MLTNSSAATRFKCNSQHPHSLEIGFQSKIFTQHWTVSPSSPLRSKGTRILVPFGRVLTALALYYMTLYSNLAQCSGRMTHHFAFIYYIPMHSTADDAIWFEMQHIFSAAENRLASEADETCSQFKVNRIWNTRQIDSRSPQCLIVHDIIRYFQH